MWITPVTPASGTEMFSGWLDGRFGHFWTEYTFTDCNWPKGVERSASQVGGMCDDHSRRETDLTPAPAGRCDG
jgi:hypothetical protein